MFSCNNNFVFFTLLSVLGFVRCLVELPGEGNNEIAIAEAVIRETINNLFATFRIKDVGHKPRLKDFSIIHEFFVSITLKDCDNLKKIARLSQVYNLDNNTFHFMTQINEVLNESDKRNEATDDIHVNTLIEKFIDKLRDLKKIYKFNRNFANSSINSKILDYFNNRKVTFTNITNKVEDAHNSEEIWRPTEASGRRIFQGHRTRIKHYPFMASIHFFERFQCAGSIIKQDLVITAASCLQLAWNNRFFRENPSFLSVQIGSNYYEASGEHISALEVYFHPDYIPKTLNNNLAIVRLGTLIVFSKKHKKVKRVLIDQNPTPLPVNTNGIVIVGWGAKDRTNVVYDPWNNRLSFAELDYYPLSDCQEVYSKEYVTRKHFCAGYFSKGSGACQHDVGGPGLSGGILVGVISFGPPTCGTPDAPTVFTKVGFYKDWINSIIKKPVPVIIRLTTLLQPKTTIAPHYSDRTTKRFKVIPVNMNLDNTRTTSYNIKMGLPENSLRILEDKKLFKEFMSTMFEEEDKEYLGLSKDAKNSGEGKAKQYLKKKVTTTTSTITASQLLSDESIYEDDDSEENSVNKLTSSPPLSLSEEDRTYEEEVQTKMIKRYTSTAKMLIYKNSKKYKFLSTTLPMPHNAAKYINENREMLIPTMKAIEEENDISLPAKTLKLLDDDMLFQELLSSVLNSEEKKVSAPSNNKIIADSTELKTIKPSIKNKHPNISKVKYGTEYDNGDKYKDRNKDVGAGEKEYEDEDDDNDDYKISDNDDGKGDGNEDDEDNNKDYDENNDEDDDQGDDKGEDEDGVFNSNKVDVEDEDENADKDEDEYENELIRKEMPKKGAVKKRTTSVPTYNSADEGASNDYESKLEQEITDLLDDIDVRKLLESNEASNSGDKEEQMPKQITKKKISGKKEINKKRTASSSDEYS